MSFGDIREKFTYCLITILLIYYQIVMKENQELRGLQRNKSVRTSSWIHMEMAISELHGSTRE